MRLRFLGVRGSTPAPGPDFVRYGGHTSCIAVSSSDGSGPDGGRSAPWLLLDTGTGVRDLPPLLAGAPFRGCIVLSHLHWDHVQGLPFCPSLDRPDAEVELWVPVDLTASPRTDPDDAAREQLARQLSPPSFPIDPFGLLGRWRFRGVTTGPVPLSLPPEAPAQVQVRVAPIPHKGGLTVGIRVEVDGASLAYLPDHVLTSVGPSATTAAAEELVSGVDVLVHDGQYLDAEQAIAQAYGHTTLTAALALADRCSVGSLVLTHHAPGRRDDDLDALAAAVTVTPGGRPVRIAHQGLELTV